MHPDVKKVIEGTIVVSADELKPILALIKKHKKTKYGQSIKRKAIMGFEVGELCDSLFASPSIVRFMDAQTLFFSSQNPNTRVVNRINRDASRAAVKTWNDLRSFHNLFDGSDKRYDLFSELRAKTHRLIKYLEKRTSPRIPKLNKVKTNRIKYRSVKPVL